MKQPSYFKASLLSSLIAMLPAIVFFVFAALNGSGILENGEIDNDPMRAGWALLFLSPIIYVALVMFFYIVSRLLFSFGKLHFKYIELLVIFFSTLLALYISHDSIQMFASNLFIFIVWLSIGAVSWHYFGIKSFNKLLHRTP